MRKFILSAGIVTALMFACLVYIVIKEDRTAPVIMQVNSSLVYREGEDTSLLLDGVKAMDDVDGDISSSVMVGDLITMPDGKAAKVTYLAKDSSNNVGQLDMIIPYEKEGEAAPADVGEANPVEPETVKEEAPSEEKEKESEEAFTPANPVLLLSETEVTISRREEFDPKNYIKDIKDDKDSVTALLDKVAVTGTYDVNKRGTYVLILTVTDSDGNSSDSVSLILTVE